jgi:transposase-like protein
MESKQNKTNGKHVYNLRVSEKFKTELPEGDYEVAFRRWLVRELNDKNMTRTEAATAFNLSGHTLLHEWTKKYSDDHELSLPTMTVEEKLEKQALEKRIKELEKKLDGSVMHVKALNTLIDIAEEQLKISIRKKSGTKQ